MFPEILKKNSKFITNKKKLLHISKQFSEYLKYLLLS